MSAEVEVPCRMPRRGKADVQIYKPPAARLQRHVPADHPAVRGQQANPQQSHSNYSQHTHTNQTHPQQSHSNHTKHTHTNQTHPQQSHSNHNQHTHTNQTHPQQSHSNYSQHTHTNQTHPQQSYSNHTRHTKINPTRSLPQESNHTQHTRPNQTQQSHSNHSQQPHANHSQQPHANATEQPHANHTQQPHANSTQQSHSSHAPNNKSARLNNRKPHSSNVVDRSSCPPEIQPKVANHNHIISQNHQSESYVIENSYNCQNSNADLNCPNNHNRLKSNEPGQAVDGDNRVRTGDLRTYINRKRNADKDGINNLINSIDALSFKYFNNSAMPYGSGDNNRIESDSISYSHQSGENMNEIKNRLSQNISESRRSRPDRVLYVPKGRRNRDDPTSPKTSPLTEQNCRAPSPAFSITSIVSEFSGRQRYETGYSRPGSRLSNYDEEDAIYGKSIYNNSSRESTPGFGSSSKSPAHRVDNSVHSKENVMHPVDTSSSRRRRRGRKNRIKRGSRSREHSYDSLNRGSCNNLNTVYSNDGRNTSYTIHNSNYIPGNSVSRNGSVERNSNIWRQTPSLPTSPSHFIVENSNRLHNGTEYNSSTTPPAAGRRHSYDKPPTGRPNADRQHTFRAVRSLDQDPCDGEDASYRTVDKYESVTCENVADVGVHDTLSSINYAPDRTEEDSCDKFNDEVTSPYQEKYDYANQDDDYMTYNWADECIKEDLRLEALRDRENSESEPTSPEHDNYVSSNAITTYEPITESNVRNESSVSAA